MVARFGSAQMVWFAFGLSHGTFRTNSNSKMVDVLAARLRVANSPKGWPFCQLSSSTGRFLPFWAEFHGRYSVAFVMTRSRVTLSASVKPSGRRTVPFWMYCGG